MATIPSSAQTFTLLATFDGTNGAAPFDLVQGLDGNFYGTTSGGGAHASGTVFKLTPSGTLTTLYSFCTRVNCTDGYGPQAGLVQATNGNLYGTTTYGGTGGSSGGTVFRISRSGALTTVYNFCTPQFCTDGLHPYAGLLLTLDGNLYGTTQAGGSRDSGAVFKVKPGGAFSVSYSFCVQPACADGSGPLGELIQGAGGNLYGTTPGGGSTTFGTIFKMSPAGSLTILHSFCQQTNCPDGSSPSRDLVQEADGTLYGTTSYGGPINVGTVFKLSPAGVLNTLYTFCSQANCADGESPYSGLIQATDGNFYGVTSFGGASNSGTIFTITKQGALTTLHSFCVEANCADGAYPFARLFQATDGSIYGTAQYGGGSHKSGTAFKLDVGLGPFVRTLPALGAVGATVEISGNNLDSTSAVSFNGVPANFSVNSASEITATVPAAATTGKLTVTTKKGTLTSDVAFRVVP